MRGTTFTRGYAACSGLHRCRTIIEPSSKYLENVQWPRKCFFPLSLITPFLCVDTQHVFGACSTNQYVKHTKDGGKTWLPLVFNPQSHSTPLGGQWQWNLVPDQQSGREPHGYHTWGGIDVQPTMRTPRSYEGANATSVYTLDPVTSTLSVTKVAKRVSITGLPHDVNM
eukprot:SAG31_NODE_4630_length_3085_cov_2.376758_4_plen_169_part_00